MIFRERERQRQTNRQTDRSSVSDEDKIYTDFIISLWGKEACLSEALDFLFFWNFSSCVRCSHWNLTISRFVSHRAPFKGKHSLPKNMVQRIKLLLF